MALNITPTPVDVTSGNQTLAGTKTFSGTTNFTAVGNQLLLKNSTNSDPTVIHRADGTNYYMLLSDAGTSPSATWNALRPLAINQATGLLTSSNGQSFAGGLSISSQITSTVATGTAPLVIASTTRVANLNVASAGNADTVTNGVYTTGNQSISGIKTFSNGFIPGSTQGYPNYELLLDFGADAANTWRRVVSAVLVNATYSSIGFKIEIVDPQANHAVAGSVNSLRNEVYYVACVRTQDTVVDTPDACYVTGPGNRIRATKTATGTYEIHIQNDIQYREYRVNISVYAVNGGHTVTYYAGDTASAGTAQYNSTVSTTQTDRFQNIAVGSQITSTVAQGTPPLVVTSTTRVANLNVASAGNADTVTNGVYLASTQTLTNKTLTGAILNDGYTEEVFAITGTTPALSPTNGSIQTWTLSGNSTPTAGTWNAGQSVTLMIDDGSAFTVTWTSLAVTWKTNSGFAPTLNTSGFTVIQLWKVGDVIYGTRTGDA